MAENPRLPPAAVEPKDAADKPDATDTADTADALARLRQAGADRLLPVQWHHIENLALRLERCDGALRLNLQGKLQRALAGCAQDLNAARALAPQPAPAEQPGPLAELLQHANALANAHANVHADARGPALAEDGQPALQRAAGGLAELKALREFRHTWARLSVGQQIQRSRAKVPDNPGPLNSHHLVLRTLDELQALSPAYLERYMAYADALLWLDQATGGGTLAAVNVVHKDSAKPIKPAATRRKRSSPPKARRRDSGVGGGQM